MYALVYDGKVAQLAEETFPVHEDLSWVEADESVKVGYLYQDGSFEEPTVTGYVIPDTVFQKAVKRMVKGFMLFNESIVGYVNGEITKTQLNNRLDLLKEEYDTIKNSIETLVE